MNRVLDSPPVETIGPYRLEALIGRGGMGEVYQAYDRRLDRRVAVKHIRPDKEVDESSRRRLRREARAVAALSHPAIVQIFDIVESADGDWIVMEYVEGSTLRDLIQQEPLGLALCLRVAREVADGLAFAHSRDIVHRDLKTENVMLASDVDRPKILDFGLAKRLSGGASDASLTAVGTAVGTCRAMSPEQAQGYRVDARSDLFSFGVLLYECLSGVSPFAGSSQAITLTQVCTHRQTPVSELRSETPVDLSRLIDRLLGKLPEQRPANARLVVEELEAIIRRRERDFSEAKNTGGSEDDETLYRGLDSSTVEEPNLETSRSSKETSPANGWTARNRRRLIGFAGAMALVGLAISGVWRFQVNDPGKAPTPAAQLSVYQLYQQAQDHLDHFFRPEALDRAIESFEQVLALQPEHAAAFAGLARAYWQQHEIKKDPFLLNQALQNARRAVALEEHLAVAQVNLGLVETTMEQFSSAEERFQKVLKLDPENAIAQFGLAKLYTAQALPERALEALKKAVEIEPDAWRYHGEIGVLHYQAGRYDEAETYFTKSADLEPENPGPRHNLAAVYQLQGRYQDAIRELQAALEVQPSAVVYTNLGNLFYAQGMFPEAVDAFDKAVKKGSGHYLRWANLADAWRWVPGGEEEAARAYLRAIQLLREKLEEKPEDGALRSRLALYLARRNECAASQDEIERIEALPKRAAGTLFKLVLAHEACNQRDLALDALARALAAGYPFEPVRTDPELLELRQDVRFHQLAIDAQSEPGTRG